MPRATVIKYKIGEPIPSIVEPSAIKNELPPMSFANVQNGSGDKKIKKDAASATAKKFDSNYKPMSKIEVSDNLM